MNKQLPSVKTMIRRIACLSILLLLFLPDQSAQQPFFRTHDLGSGFQRTDVTSLYESSDGYIWFGSDEGLIRYDGIYAQLFTSGDSLTNYNVSAIYEDRHGQLWVGYRSGAIYQLHDRKKLVKWEPEEGTPIVPITGFAEDESGNLWIATYGEGLYYYRDLRLYNINTDDGLLGDDLYTLVQVGPNEIWVGTDGGISICSLENGEKKIDNITTGDGLPDEIVRAIVPDEQGNCWIGTYDRGFCYFNAQSRSFEFPAAEWDGGIINQLELLSDRELWIGTDGNGLWRYHLRTGETLPVKKGELKGAKVYDLHRDREGNIWVLSNTEGICSANLQFEYLDEAIENIQAVLVDRTSLLWVGTTTGLFTFLPNGQGERYFQKQFPDLNLNVISLYQDIYDNIWIGTFGEGVFIFNKTGQTIRRFTEEDGLTNGSILSIDGLDDKVWMATLGGVTEYSGPGDILQKQGPGFVNYKHENGLGTNFIYKVFVDSKGRTWFGTDGEGISVLSEGEIINYDTAAGKPINSVYGITEDLRGHIWFSTATEGVFEFDGDNFSHLSLKEGLRNMAITSLLTDANGHILIVHPNGIDLLFPETRNLVYYGPEVGIDNFDPNLNAVFSDEHQQIWIGTQREVIRYTALAEELARTPRTLLDQVSIFLEPIDFTGNQVFPYDQNNLFFEYVGLWYTNPAAVKYRYLLEGFDQDWILSSDRQAIYSNLPPGNYVFQVAATHNESFEGAPVAGYAFTIKYPLWEQPWFIVLGLASLALILVWFIKTREKRLQKEALLKKEKIESQFEALKSQINPHFLFNSFNTLITIIEENPEMGVLYVERLSDFYRSILQYREKEVIPLEEELQLVKNYAFLLKKRYGENFNLQIEVAANGPTAYVAPLTLQMLVENAVKHNVISRSKPLWVKISMENKDYVTVCNNLQKKIKPERSTGFGLQSISKRYDLLSENRIKIQETPGFFRVDVPLIKNEVS